MVRYGEARLGVGNDRRGDRSAVTWLSQSHVSKRGAADIGIWPRQPQPGQIGVIASWTVRYSRSLASCSGKASETVAAGGRCRRSILTPIYAHFALQSALTYPRPHPKLRIAQAREVPDHFLDELLPWLMQHRVLASTGKR